jgi:Zn-dependent peptidase ImmA (M78 family)
MKIALSRLKELFPGLNRRRFTEIDCWRNAERFNALVKTAPLAVDGYCGVGVYRGKIRSYIFLNSILTGEMFLRAFLHELAHVALHQARGTKAVLYLQSTDITVNRQENEADLFALIALYPQELFLDLCNAPADDLAGYSQPLLMKRLDIYRRLGE